MSGKEDILYKLSSFFAKLMIWNINLFIIIMVILASILILDIVLFIATFGLTALGMLFGQPMIPAIGFITMTPVTLISIPSLIIMEIMLYISTFYIHKKVTDNPEKIKKYLSDPQSNSFIKWYLENIDVITIIQLIYPIFLITFPITLIDVLLINNIILYKVEQITKSV